MTLEKACSDTKIFLVEAGIQPGASSTRGKWLTTELPLFLRAELKLPTAKTTR